MRFLFFIHFFIFSAFAVVDIASVDFGEKEEGLSGSVYGSFQTKRGNTDRDESEYGGRIQLDTKKTITWLQGEVEHDESSDTTTDDNAFIHLRHIRQIINPSWAMEFYGQLKKDKFKNLQKRQLMGMGPRVKLADSKEYGKLFFGLSLMDERINYTQNSTDENEHNLRLSSYLSYKMKVNNNLEFSLLSYYQPKVNETSDYLATSLAEMTIHLSKVIDLSYLLEFDYDTRPPQGIYKTDVRQKLSFVYRFGKDDPFSAYAHNFIQSDEEVSNQDLTPMVENGQNGKRTVAGVWKYGKERFELFEDGRGSYRNADSPYTEKLQWKRSVQENGIKVISIRFIDEEGREGRVENYLCNGHDFVGLSLESVKVFKR